MENYQSPLKYTAIQSHATMTMEAATAHHAAHSTKQTAEADAEGTTMDNVIEFFDWANYAPACSGAGCVGESATTALDAYIKEDATRAILIAAASGAAVMGLARP